LLVRAGSAKRVSKRGETAIGKCEHVESGEDDGEKPESRSPGDGVSDVWRDGSGLRDAP
jgi:hypothetical protein